MRIEAFTEAKDPTKPESNEDRLVIVPGRLLAVLDGVSARSAARYDGMLSGQFAAERVQRELLRGIPGDGGAIVDALTEALAAEHRRFGLAGVDPGLRLATGLALVMPRGAAMEIVLVGDSGVRVDGAAPWQMLKVLDAITAALRHAAWHHAAARGHDAEAREALSRAAVMHGTAGQGARDAGWSVADLAAVDEAAAAACARRFPSVDRAAIAGLVAGGIAGGQGRHQNNPESPLGYGCLDGTAVPERFIGRHTVPMTRAVELFTDGYFAPGAAFGVESWEARFREVEREDPAKIGRFASVKGSVGGRWSDDRTYLGQCA